MRTDLKNLFVAAASWKVLVLWIIWAGSWVFPFNAGNYSANFLDQPGSSPNLSSYYETWDAQVYIHLARMGYSQGGFDDAFYPLFPLLIRAGAWVTGGHFLTVALLLSIFFTLGAMGLLFEVAAPRWGERVAFWGSLFLLGFPLGFFMGLAYTESLFLFLVLLIVWGDAKGKLWAMVLGAFLAPLTRPTGLLLGLPLAVGAWQKKNRSSFSALGAWAIGVAAYFGSMMAWTGDPFSGFEAQKFSVGHFSVMNLLHPIDWFLKNFIHGPFSWMDPGTTVWDRIFFAGFVAVFAMAWKELSIWERTYCLTLGLIPALSGDLMSYGRYLLALYPLFIYLGKKLEGKEWAYLIPATLLQVFFLLRHSLNGFVA